MFLLTQDHMQNFKILAKLLVGCTDSGGYVKVTPKYFLVGGEGGVSDFFLRYQSYYHIILVTQDHMQSFKIVA